MLLDVYNALDAGDNLSAMQLLTEVIQTEPSAQAWYIAARLTNDRDKALRHLKRALLLDAKHAESLVMLRQLNGDSSITLGDIKEEVVQTLEYEHQRLPVVRNLSKRQTLLGALALAVVLIAGLVLAARVLRQPGPSLIPEQAPQAAAVAIVPLNAVWQHFQNSGLPVQSMARGQTVDGRDLIELTVRDTDGQSVPVSILVYESIPALVGDGATLDMYEAQGRLLGAANMRLAYPASLSSYMSRQLENTLRSVPGV
jgi:hypothetical protein